MKKFFSGLILTVVVTPALAESADIQLDLAPSMLKTSSYTLEIKEGVNTLSTLNFAAIDSARIKIENWNVESHAYKTSNAVEIDKVMTGFEMTLNPVKNSENFIDISFLYHQPIKENKQVQPIFKFETGVVLAKGGSFCSDLSGTGEKVKFCLSRM